MEWRSAGYQCHMTRVLIAIDGTDLDHKIAETAHRLFGDDSDFWAVNVQDIANPPVGGWPMTVPVTYGGAYPYRLPELYTLRPDSETSREVVEETQRRAEITAQESGLDDARVVAEVGEPAEAIIRAANEHGADVIVVGTHDRSWWSRLVKPSVSGRLTGDAPVPVLLVTESG